MEKAIIEISTKIKYQNHWYEIQGISTINTLCTIKGYKLEYVKYSQLLLCNKSKEKMRKTIHTVWNGVKFLLIIFESSN